MMKSPSDALAEAPTKLPLKPLPRWVHTCKVVARAAALHFDKPVESLEKGKRGQDTPYERMIAIYVAMRLSKMSRFHVGYWFGMGDAHMREALARVDNEIACENKLGKMMAIDIQAVALIAIELRPSLKR